jgi:hypothetical protein
MRVKQGMKFADNVAENTKTLVGTMGGNTEKDLEEEPRQEGYTWAKFKEQYIKPLQPIANVAVDSAFHVKQFITTDLPESGVRSSVQFPCENQHSAACSHPPVAGPLMTLHATCADRDHRVPVQERRPRRQAGARAQGGGQGH